MTSTQKTLLRIFFRFFSFFTLFSLYFVVSKGSLSMESLKTVLLTDIGFVISGEIFTMFRVYLATPQKAGK